MIINIIGLPASGKTTLCEIISKIDDKYDIKKLVVKDTDEFLDNVQKYDTTKINEYLGKNENKDIIFCGLSKFLAYLKNDLVKDVIIVDLEKKELLKNCKNRFFDKKILFLFFILSHLTYSLLLHFYFCHNLHESIKISDKNNVYIEISSLKPLEEYKDYTIESLKTNIICYNSFDQLDKIILLILDKCDVKKDIKKENIHEVINKHMLSKKINFYSVYILKFILLLIFYIPSYKISKILILYPLWTFFLPTFGILELLNILYFVIWIKQNKKDKHKYKRLR